MGSISCSAMTASSTPRRPRSPPWIFGCSVLTRPPMISGKPVWAETSRTGTPLAASSFAVPPVESISMLRFASARASSTMPVLSDTERSARRTVNTLGASRQAQFLQLLAQGPAVDSQNAGGAALVTFRIVQHDAEQRLFDLAQHEIVQMRWPVTIQTGEVIAQCTLSVIAQRQFSGAQPDTGVPPGSTLLFCCHVRSPQNPIVSSAGKRTSRGVQAP